MEQSSWNEQKTCEAEPEPAVLAPLSTTGTVPVLNIKIKNLKLKTYTLPTYFNDQKILICVSLKKEKKLLPVTYSTNNFFLFFQSLEPLKWDDSDPGTSRGGEGVEIFRK